MVSGGLQLNEDVVGIWIAAEPETQDMMIHIAAPEEGNPVMTIRFRHYVDDKVFDSADEKVWHRVEGTKDDLQSMIDLAEELTNGLKETVPNVTVEKVLMGEGGFDAFEKEFMALPCIHAKQISEEEWDNEQPTIN